MSEIDERLAEIRARLDPATDIEIFDHHTPADLGYLLDLVTQLRQQRDQARAVASSGTRRAPSQAARARNGT